MRILFLGDVVGEPGLAALRRLPSLSARLGADLVVANGENTANGLGITAKTAREMRSAGVQVVTTGNHVWDKKEFLGEIDALPWVIRPANYPPGAPGRGWCGVEVGGVLVAVANLSGRIFMDPLDCPFRAADRVLGEIGARTRVVLVDFHAEATSEKRALGWHLDGRVTAVLGTHTHVATADAQVLPGGTGYITDVGMTGPRDSVIGVPREGAVTRFVSQLPARLGVAKTDAVLCGVLVEADPATGRCLGIERVEQAHS
ncbi:MAG: TIGR00282 family metallophosphoesterase [Deferrisomatales bacterium]